MKKLILIMAIAFANHIIAQETAVLVENRTDFRKKLLFGLKAGVNYSNVYDAKGEAFVADSKVGFAGGAFLSIPIGKFLGVQPEVLYSQKGFQATGNILGSNYILTRTTNFVDVPILFSFKPSEFFSILAGPQYSYLMQQNDVFGNSNSSVEQQTEFKNDNIRKNILCFMGGIDINLKHVVLGARAGWDLQNNNGDGTSTTPRYKNVWYQATIGYRFYNH